MTLWRMILAVVIGTFIGNFVVVASRVAFGHTAPSGWEYDRECCDMQDCAQVPDEAVREVAGGYQVTLREGEHPMGAGEWFVPHGDRRLRPSGDEHRHVCHMHGRLFCLYVRAGGV